tara:strand:- start:1092 stop:1523 length:432 start_codon:yes stop_codon:yes gene_type:complete
MTTVSDIPLYEIIQEIEGVHGSETHMVIEIITNDEPKDGKPHPLIREEDVLRPDGWQLNDGIWFWCEFENQVAVFDNVAALKHWFLVDCLRDNPEDNFNADNEKLVQQNWDTYADFDAYSKDQLDADMAEMVEVTRRQNEQNS